MKKVSLLILITLFSLNVYANTAGPIDPDPNDPIDNGETIHLIVSDHATICLKDPDLGSYLCGAANVPELVDITLTQEESGHSGGSWQSFVQIDGIWVVFSIHIYRGFGIQTLRASISYDDGKKMVRSLVYPEDFSTFSTIHLDVEFDTPNNPTSYHWLTFMISPAPLLIKP